METSVRFGLILLALQFCAAADTLYLNNGDRLTGHLEGAKDGTLRLTTEYAGALAVVQAQVQGICTDQPVAAKLADGTVAAGRLEWHNESQYIRTPEALQRVVVADIIAIAHEPADLEPATESLAPEEKPKVWSGAVDAALSIRSGDTDTIDGALGVSAARTKKRNVLTLTGSGAYGEVEDTINTRRAEGQAKWQYYPRERFYVFGLVGVGHDAARKLELRSNVAGGGGYDFIKNERRTLAADAGLDYTWERWTQYDPAGREAAKQALRDARIDELRAFLVPFAETPRVPTIADIAQGLRLTSNLMNIDLDEEKREEDAINLRFSVRYGQSLFKKARLSEDLTLFPSLDAPGALRATSDLGFSTPLTERLDLRITLKSEYDTDPGHAGVDKLDNTLLTGVRYTF